MLGDDSPVAAGIQKTYELVLKGYDDFLASKLAPPAAEGEAAPKDNAAQSSAPTA